MASHRILTIATVTIFVSIGIQEVTALHCWNCTSSATNSNFCDDPFDASIITDQQRRESYLECHQPPGQKNPYSQSSVRKVVCKKMIQTVHGIYTISRACEWEDIDASKNDCKSADTPAHTKTKFCESCGIDGCNGAMQHGFSSVVQFQFLIIIPLVIEMMSRGLWI